MNNQNKPDEIVVSPQAEINSPRHLTAPKICHNPNCSFQTREPLSKCPKCGRPIWTTNEFRLISSVLIFCGFFLLVLGGGLGYIAYRNYAADGTMSERNEIGVIFIAAIAGFILSFGLAVTAAGAWQVIFGRGNRRLIYIVLIFLLALLVIVGVGRLILLFLESSDG